MHVTSIKYTQMRRGKVRNITERLGRREVDDLI